MSLCLEHSSEYMMSCASVVQWLIFNDCVFRTRNIFEFVMFHDRDEFVHIVGMDKPRQVQLKTTNVVCMHPKCLCVWEYSRGPLQTTEKKKIWSAN